MGVAVTIEDGNISDVAKACAQRRTRSSRRFSAAPRRRAQEAHGQSADRAGQLHAHVCAADAQQSLVAAGRRPRRPDEADRAAESSAATVTRLRASWTGWRVCWSGPQGRPAPSSARWTRSRASSTICSASRTLFGRNEPPPVARTPSAVRVPSLCAQGRGDPAQIEGAAAEDPWRHQRSAGRSGKAAGSLA